MSTLKPMRCDSCGGVIDRVTLICNSCGMAYMLDEDMQPVRIITSNLRFETFGSEIRVPREYNLDPDTISMYTLEEMAKNMARKILPLIEYTTEFDIRNNEYVTTGRLRVARPSRWQ